MASKSGSSAPSVDNASQMPCLGRPFQLGMLYDCRNDHLIPGVTLWNYSTLQKALDSRRHESLQFSVVSEDTIENKTSSLGVEASLKLSLMGGLVDVSGSAKFLDDQRVSKQQARVSLQYSMTSHFEQLTMQHLAVDKVEYPDVFEKKDATHVVTAVLYGAEAFFVFDREVSAKEKYRDIHGRMAVMIKKIPSVTISGEGKLDMKDTEKNEVQKFQCQYHGDIVLPENPTTFNEAVKIYKQLPQIMQSDDKGEKIIPKMVWLYPLSKLDTRAAKFVREISIGLVNQVQKLIENMRDMKMRATDLKKSEVCSNFQGINEQLSHFIEMISEYEMDTAKKLSKILPQIRGGGAEETQLADIFQQNSASPFNHHSLSSWLNGKEQEVKVLQSFLTGLNSDNVEFAFVPGELDAIVADINVENVLCFTFKVAGSHDPFLELLFDYLHTSDVHQQYAQATPTHWFQDKALSNDIKVKVKAFRSFAEANGENEETKCVVTHLNEDENDTNQGADILVYSGGLAESYMPPGKPSICKPKDDDITHDSVQITWSKPQHGAENIQSYTVFYQQDGENDQWENTSSSNESTTLDALKPETKYKVKVQGKCEIGVTLDSDVLDFETKKSPVERLAVLFKMESQHIGRDKGGQEIYKIPLIQMPSKTRGIAKCTIGDPRYLTLEYPEKVLMVVGATGSGKSTLINAIANYVLGVKWEDDFRFKLITEEGDKDQTKSVTQTITSYSFPKFEESPLPFRLTVVDTPGFGDTQGLERDEQITALIKAFFSTVGPEGIDHIDGIGFVAQSPLVRLTHTQKYIIDSILSVFGKDIGNNIFLMTTFADGAYPPVVDAIKTHIKESDPPIPIDANKLQYFKFNNSALFAKQKDTSTQTFDLMYWRVGCTSLDGFFDHLKIAPPQTLQLTRAVLNEREKLQTLIQGIQLDVRDGMNAIDEMRDEKRALEANEAKIKANKDFTYTTTEHHTKKESLPASRYVTNCLKCNRTCHYPCGIPKDSDKSGCAAMDSNGYCRSLPWSLLLVTSPC